MGGPSWITEHKYLNEPPEINDTGKADNVFLEMTLFTYQRKALFCTYLHLGLCDHYNEATATATTKTAAAATTPAATQEHCNTANATTTNTVTTIQRHSKALKHAWLSGTIKLKQNQIQRAESTLEQPALLYFSHIVFSPSWHVEPGNGCKSFHREMWPAPTDLARWELGSHWGFEGRLCAFVSFGCCVALHALLSALCDWEITRTQLRNMPLMGPDGGDGGNGGHVYLKSCSHQTDLMSYNSNSSRSESSRQRRAAGAGSGSRSTPSQTITRPVILGQSTYPTIKTAQVRGQPVQHLKDAQRTDVQGWETNWGCWKPATLWETTML